MMLVRTRGVRVTALLAAAVLACAGAATAASGSAKPSALFKGSGGDYMNNAERWTNEGKGSFSFKTSKTGGQILNFHGTYQYYCGAGTGYVNDNAVTISASGQFDARGHYVEKSHGRVTGTNYLRLWGRFAPGGKSAAVNYLSDFVYAGKKVSHPYSTSIKSQGSSCESWVRGTAKAR